MRGDRPGVSRQYWIILSFTPHARGSTLVRFIRGTPCLVYPACAGIDLLSWKGIPRVEGLPRMRGDRPSFQFDLVALKLFTPHARGSTFRQGQKLSDAEVYPACAGIDRLPRDPTARWLGLPRMRGDRPLLQELKPEGNLFTPHARGSTRERMFHIRKCRVYPACAGIDLLAR